MSLYDDGRARAALEETQSLFCSNTQWCSEKATYRCGMCDAPQCGCDIVWDKASQVFECGSCRYRRFEESSAKRRAAEKRERAVYDTARAQVKQGRLGWLDALARIRKAADNLLEELDGEKKDALGWLVAQLRCKLDEIDKVRFPNGAMDK